MPGKLPPSSELAQAIAAGMPACPNCGGRNVRRSEALRLTDTFMAWFNYSPYRCRACQHRFFKRVKAQPGPAAS